MSAQDISVVDLKKRMDAGEAPRIIDVREDYEYEEDHIEAENIPMGDIPSKIAELGAKDAELVVCCRSGGRSGRIKMYLESQGFTNVRNLTGGMLDWKAQIDPSFNVE